MSTILAIHARQILDSRGNPTVEADVVTESGAFGRELLCHPVLQPASMKAVELRDKRNKNVYLGKGRA